MSVLHTSEALLKSPSKLLCQWLWSCLLPHSSNWSCVIPLQPDRRSLIKWQPIICNPQIWKPEQHGMVACRQICSMRTTMAIVLRNWMYSLQCGALGNIISTSFASLPLWSEEANLRLRLWCSSHSFWEFGRSWGADLMFTLLALTPSLRLFLAPPSIPALGSGRSYSICPIPFKSSQSLMILSNTVAAYTFSLMKSH